MATGARWSSFMTTFRPFSNWYSCRPDISIVNAEGFASSVVLFLLNAL
ncbi:hypothetical protein MGSAQ_002977 [marine sediment metagenome]|uniref:Uncharacterized protein n=1 Tax=marine sediment metagenome TaxID=412755 RepID=A0A1B6NQF5_9ZZZZ